MRVSVIMPARDAESTISRSLEALARQDLDGEYEVIVVDDGSSDRTMELARSAPGPVTVHRQPSSGPGGARNAGAARARSELLAFCDADVFATGGWLRAGIEALREADLVQGRVLPDPSAALGPFDRTIWVTSHGGLWETANLFMRRALFDRLGGFADDVRPRAGKPMAEDVFLGYRALRSGARCRFSPEALAYHAVFPRTWREYVAERARLAYFPAMARKAPELRTRFLYRRLFLNPRTARLDLAIGGGALASALRSPLPLLAAAPYAKTAWDYAGRGEDGGTPRWAVAAADVAADLVGLAAMTGGSLRYRSPVL
jgi:glycosyltransferase involved in cell wall biosynthesis